MADDAIVFALANPDPEVDPALAALVGDDLAEDMVIPSPFDPRVGPAVATAVAEAARRDGVARR